jgi:hypothetical protein
MLGGGFIGQMYETNKKNLEILKRNKKQFFKIGKVANKEIKETVAVNTLTSEERKALLQETKNQSLRELRKRLLLLTISIILALIILSTFYFFVADHIIDFIR